MPRFGTWTSRSHVLPREPALPEPGFEILPFRTTARKRNPYRERKYFARGWPRDIRVGQDPAWSENPMYGDQSAYAFVQPVKHMPGDENNDTEPWRPLSDRLTRIYRRPPFPLNEWPEWLLNEYYRGIQDHKFADEGDDWLAKSKSQTILCSKWLELLARGDVIEEWERLHPDRYRAPRVEELKEELEVDRRSYVPQYALHTPLTARFSSGSEGEEAKGESTRSYSTSADANESRFGSRERSRSQHRRRSSGSAEIILEGYDGPGPIEDHTEHVCSREQHSPRTCRSVKLSREGDEAQTRAEPAAAHMDTAPWTCRNFRLQNEVQPKGRVHFEDDPPASTIPVKLSPLPPTPGGWPDESEEVSPSALEPHQRMPDPAYMDHSRQWSANAKQGISSPAHPSPGAKEYEEKLHRGRVDAALDAYVRTSAGSHGLSDFLARNKLTLIKDLAEMRARRDGVDG